MSLGGRKGEREGETGSHLLGRCAPTGLWRVSGLYSADLPLLPSLLVMMKVLTVADWLWVLIFHPLEKDYTSLLFIM